MYLYLCEKTITHCINITVFGKGTVKKSVKYASGFSIDKKSVRRKKYPRMYIICKTDT